MSKKVLQIIFWSALLQFLIAPVVGCKDQGTYQSLASDTTLSLEAREWSKKIDEYPENVEYYLYRAEVFLEDGRKDLAIADYKRCIELEPDIPSHSYKLGDALFAADETTEALEAYEEATVKGPTDITATFKLAQFLYFVRQFERSNRIFDKLLTLQPSHAEGNFFRAMLFKEMGDTTSAIAQFEKTIELMGSDYNSTMQLANLYYSQGKKEKALENYNRALAIDPKSDEAAYSRGLFYHQEGDYEKAMLDYQKTIDINASHYYAYYNAGNILAENGNYDRALEHFEICIKLKPDYAKGYNRIAQCLELKGDLEKARVNYERSLQIDPNFALAKQGLERIGL